MKSKYAVHRPVVNAYLVRERDRRRVRELLGIVLALAPLGAALLIYTWVHLEVLGAGIQVNAIAPGSVDTPMLAQGMPGARPDMTPDDIAAAALYLACDAPAAMTGQVIDIYARGT